MMSSSPEPRNLLRSPCWRAEDLGLPLPPSPHANSVCLPTWQDVIDYERADPRVISRLQTGYPRFFIHPLTERLFAACRQRFADADEICHVYPSHATARRCLQSVRRWTGQPGRIESWSDDGPVVVCLPKQVEEAARKHWRHTGEGISSRQADAVLVGRAAADAVEAKREVRARIASLAGVSPEHVYLFGSGMAAIYAVHRAVNRLGPGRKSVQVGFPYVDTLKIQQDMGPGVHFFARGNQPELGQLEQLLRAERVSAIYCEFPSNPLLACPDLSLLATWARRHEIPLVVDETLATYVNVDLKSAADVIITSLTKYFTGAGDVLAGAVIVSPCSSLGARLQEVLEQDYEDLLWSDDAALLARYSTDFTQRLQQINRTAEQVCDFCRSHPAIAEVYYPKFGTQTEYAAFRRPAGGYGGLFSLLLHGAQTHAQPFFDALQISKGPNLGTYFSLSCPFTLLAHYQELDWAESCGVSRCLIRMSIGLEDPDDLIDRIQRALDQLS